MSYAFKKPKLEMMFPETHQQTNFSQLPEEIKLMIFSYFTTKDLSKCLAPVCREWWTLCKDPSFWKKVELKITKEKPVEVFSDVLLRCRRSLRSLELSSDYKISDFISSLEEGYPWFLKELYLGQCQSFTDEDMYSIVGAFPDIEILNLAFCGVSISFSCVQIFVTLKNLRSLSIWFDRQTDIRCLKLIAKQCSKLEALDVRGVRNVDQLAYSLARHGRQTIKHLFMSRKCLSALGICSLTFCENLSTLYLKWEAEALPFTAEALQALSRMQNLKWFHLDNPGLVKPQAWVNFFSCPNMTTLRIIDICFSSINDKGLESLAMTCRHIVILVLSSCQKVHNRGLKAVIRNCSELLYLDIAYIKGVTDDILTDIPETLPRLKYFGTWQCGIEESVIKKFTKKCPQIKVLYPWHHCDLKYTVDEKLKIKWHFRNFEHKFFDRPVWQRI